MQASAKTIGVMVVDDHQTMLWGLSRLIDGEQPRMRVVGTARSCDEALAQAPGLAPDVILLDLDLDGRSALDILPGLLLGTASRALILTGERQQSTLDQAVLKGARGLLRKDASAEQVLQAIERVHQGELCLDGETMGRVFSEFLAARTPRVDPEAEKQAALTCKERKIIAAVVQGNGASNKALANKLFITEHTLRNHLCSIYQKLDVGNRLELYVYAMKHQLGLASS
ncbi:response regulator transcription factor [Variovorax defluvii]|uniref:Response regulator transcription factor n=1 Tax=Variovorax defluvii TaxID=913761 RepID=A0ABP8HG50_9BURK